MLFAPKYMGFLFFIALHALIPLLDLRLAAPRLALKKFPPPLLSFTLCLLPASLRLQTGRLLHTPIISIRGGGGAPSPEPPPLGLSGRPSRPPRRRFPGLRGGSQRNGRPSLGGWVRGAGQSAASGVRLRIQDSLQVRSSRLALDALRRTWMAAEVRAAVGSCLLAISAFAEQNQS